MRVYLHSLAEEAGRGEAADLFPVESLRSCWSLGSRKHTLASDAESSDALLFVDTHMDNSPLGWNLGPLRAHPLYRRYRERAFVYCGMDRPIPLVPGFYPSIEGRWARRHRIRSSCYLAPPNPLLRLLAPPDNPAYVASFVGSCSGKKPVRIKLLAQSAEDMPVRDSHAPFTEAIRRGDTAGELAYKRLFVDLAEQSAFMLCPAGAGASSFRVFEAMEMGRAPVVISDAWTPVLGPDWDRFMVRVKERDIPQVRGILKERMPEAAAMAKLARSAWESHFAPDRIFDHLVDQCAEMLAGRRIPESIASRFALLHLLRPKHLRMWIRQVRHSLR